MSDVTVSNTNVSVSVTDDVTYVTVDGAAALAAHEAEYDHSAIGGGGGGGGATLEEMQDDLGTTSLVAGTGLTKTYDDGAGTITLDVDEPFTAGDRTKLDGVEASADVTDATNVAAAGAHMSGGTDVPVADGGTGASTAAGARTNLGVDAAGTDNSTDVTLAGTPDYLTIAGQTITLGLVDLTSDVTGDLPVAEGGTGASTAAAARTNLGVAIGSDVQAWSAVLDATSASFTTADETKLDGIEAGAEVNDVASVNSQTGVVVLDADDIDDTATAHRFATAAQLSKLDAIEALADVTDATNVDAAGATMNTDTDVSGTSWVLDEDTLSSDSATKVPTQQSVKAYADGKVAKASFPVSLGFALSDESTALTTGTGKLTVRAPFAFTLTDVRASLTTASSSGVVTVDVNESGTSVLSTKLTVDASEKTSETAATAAVISDSAIADDAELTFDIDGAGTGAAGLKVWLLGTRSV